MKGDVKKENTKKRHDKIRERYNELSAEKINGKQLYSFEALLEMLHEEFSLATVTIYRIIIKSTNDDKV